MRATRPPAANSQARVGSEKNANDGPRRVAISEATGIPNNGDMHILERLHLAQPDVLHDDLEITAPKVLDATWKTTRIFRRYPERHYEVIEGECEQEDLLPGKDEFGNDIFVANPQGQYGSVHTIK